LTDSDALKVLGIDPGVTVTGYGLVRVEGREQTCLGFGAIKTNDKLSRGERLLEVHRGLLEAVRRYSPHEVAVEDFYAGHVRAAVAVGEARAMALLVAAQAELPVSLYKPLEVKQFVTSYGHGSKEQVATMVAALLHMDKPPESPDAADALAVALCHCLKRNSKLETGKSAAVGSIGTRARPKPGLQVKRAIGGGARR
jgi:crossover junction endodeoxyribonuclease RuvC